VSKGIPDSVNDKLHSRLSDFLHDTVSIVHINSRDYEDVKKLDNGCAFINMQPVNSIRRINKFHENVNKSMEFGQIYVSLVETLEQRSERLKNSGLLKFFNVVIYTTDFLFHRVLHKIAILNKLYFFITLGKSRPLSKAESLGRLISCGFEIQNEFELDGLLYIISKKIALPEYDMNASFSLIFAMRRVGYKGKIISVYKVRTMHPFSEYLQSYIIQTNKLHKKGKINKDYRITNWGKFMRKYWLDELPMIVNFFKGELNIVGVRPLSQDFFKRYPKYLQELRIKVKPGLIPPYYADMPNSLDEVLESEERYILSKLKKPLRTDWIYFWRAINNIFIKGARSK
jgi:hypothetical protein